MALKCPFCQGTKSNVIDSRPEGFGIMRRRECTSCEKRYTTREVTDLDLATIRQESMGIGHKIQLELVLMGQRCEKLVKLLREGEIGAQKKDV
jgi:transcriptional regulator NrdR family protein